MNKGKKKRLSDWPDSEQWSVTKGLAISMGNLDEAVSAPKRNCFNFLAVWTMRI